MKKSFAILLFPLAALAASAEIDPVTLREETAPNRAALAPEPARPADETAREKLAAYAARDEAPYAAVRAVAVFPRRRDWEFTGGAELAFGREFGANRVELSVAAFQSHSDDYGAYQTAIPLLVTYAREFAVELWGDAFAPYVAVSAGVCCDDYLVGGSHVTKWDAVGAVGCGARWKITRGWTAEAGYRFVWVANDEAEQMTGMGGGHSLNLGLDFRF